MLLDTVSCCLMSSQNFSGEKEAERDGETETEHHVFLQRGIHYT